MESGQRRPFAKRCVSVHLFWTVRARWSSPVLRLPRPSTSQLLVPCLAKLLCESSVHSTQFAQAIIGSFMVRFRQVSPAEQQSRLFEQEMGQ